MQFPSNPQEKLPSISYFGTVCVLLFLLFSLIRQVLIPFGDEPDFVVRASKLLNEENLWWTPYYLFDGLLNNINVVSNCEVSGSPFALWATVETSSCLQSIEQVMLRYVLTVFVTLPLLLIVVFRRIFIYGMRVIGSKMSNQTWMHRLDALSLALMSPGLVYYLNVLSVEQFVFVLSLMVFVFWQLWLPLIAIIVMAGTQDLGNSTVVLAFIVTAQVAFIIQKKVGYLLTIMALCALVILGYIVGTFLLQYVAYIPILTAKAEDITELVNNKGYTEKYPIILRPIITFMAYNIFTPSYIKIIPLYLLTGTSLIVAFFRLNKFYNWGKVNMERHYFFKLKIDMIFAIAGISIIFFMNFLMPNYNNAKYYIFMMPFFISALLWVFNKKNIRSFFILSHLILYINLALFNL